MARKSSVLEFRRPARRYVPPGPVRGNKLRFSQGRRVRRRTLGPAGYMMAWAVIPLMLFTGLWAWDRQSVPMTLETLAPERLVAARDVPALPPARRIGETEPQRFVATMSEKAPGADIVWVDGDSGWIDGKPFRLYGVDAPEGSASRARCGEERRKSVDAKQAASALTADGEIRVRRMGTDEYERELVAISADGRDVSASLVGRGHLQYWAYNQGQAKPDWCR